MQDLKKIYLEKIRGMLDQVEKQEMEAINRAGIEAGKSIADGKVIHIFGSGHSDLIATDCFMRAGGLACINKITDQTFGRAERLEGYGRVLVEKYDFQPGEVIIIISNSGRNPVPIEVAMYAREKGLKVVAITSMNHSKAVKSRHSSGKKLYEVADIVIDNHGEVGDACIELDGVSGKTGATSTVIGCTILNMILVKAAQTCNELGKEVPIIISQNLDGTDEHNKNLWRKYKTRLGEI